MKCSPHNLRAFIRFLAATKQLYECFRPSVRLSATPFSLCYCHSIIMKCITIDRSDVHAKSQGQRSKVKVTEVKTIFAQIWAFPDCNSSYNIQMATKWCTKLEVALKRFPMFFKVIRQISKSQGTNKSLILTRIECFRCNPNLNSPMATQ